MKLLRKEKFNTNNGWGFGGKSGTREIYDNGYSIEKGHYTFRHSDKESFKTHYIVVNEDGFTIKVEGKVSDTITVFQREGSYYATFKDIKVFDRYGEPFDLIGSISLTNDPEIVDLDVPTINTGWNLDINKTLTNE